MKSIKKVNIQYSAEKTDLGPFGWKVIGETEDGEEIDLGKIVSGLSISVEANNKFAPKLTFRADLDKLEMHGITMIDRADPLPDQAPEFPRYYDNRKATE